MLPCKSGMILTVSSDFCMYKGREGKKEGGTEGEREGGKDGRREEEKEGRRDKRKEMEIKRKLNQNLPLEEFACKSVFRILGYL